MILMVLLFMANLTELSCLDSFRNTQTQKLDAKKSRFFMFGNYSIILTLLFGDIFDNLKDADFCLTLGFNLHLFYLLFMF